MANDDDTLKEAREIFALIEERESDNRKAASDDWKFARLNEQWPEGWKRLQESKGLPCLVVPRIQTFIRQVVNDGRQNKPSIKVHPADSKADPETAEIYNGLIRNIEVTSSADVAYDTALDAAATGGWGYFRVNTKYACDDAFDLDLAIERQANPFAIYGDPYSTAADSFDWNDAFVVDRMSKKQFETEYKGAAEVNWEQSGYTRLSGPWFEGNIVLTAEWWHRDKVEKTILLLSDQSVVDEETYEKQKELYDSLGVSVMGERQTQGHRVSQRLMTGAEILKTTKWAGKYIPIVPVYGEDLHIDGKRYWKGLVRDMKDAQSMLNFWRTMTTNLVALSPLAPFLGPKGAFTTDQAKWESANTEAHPYIEYDGNVAPQRQAFAGVPAGALQEALNATDDMKAISGIFDASLGARSNETSGRAIVARQREGDVSTFHFIDNLSRAIEHGGRILIDLIPKVYSGERIIRTLALDGAPSSVQLGQPVPQMQDGQPMADQSGAQLLRIFDLGVGKYDLTVETGPSYTTQRQEAADQMIELIRAFPAAAPVIGDLLAKNLDWPGADEIAKRLQMLQQHMLQGGQGGPPAPPPPDPVAMAKVQADAQKAKDDNEIKRTELSIDAYKAETDRMKVINDHRAQQQRALISGVPTSQQN